LEEVYVFFFFEISEDELIAVGFVSCYIACLLQQQQPAGPNDVGCWISGLWRTVNAGVNGITPTSLSMFVTWKRISGTGPIVKACESQQWKADGKNCHNYRHESRNNRTIEYAVLIGWLWFAVVKGS
jgi:hypothetical protein